MFADGVGSSSRVYCRGVRVFLKLDPLSSSHSSVNRSACLCVNKMFREVVSLQSAEMLTRQT